MSRDILLTLIDQDAGQPRAYFAPAELDELAQSMRANGLLQPILLRPVDGGRYVIVHGERRYRAAVLLGWSTIAAEIRPMTEAEAHIAALVENVQRADLSPIEEARAYQGMLAGGITQTALGAQIGKSQSYIASKLRLLGLPEDVQAAIAAGALTEGHAKQILRLAPSFQSVAAEVIAARRLSVAQSKAAADWLIENRQSGIDPDPNPNCLFINDLERPLFDIVARMVLLNDAWVAAAAANTLEAYSNVANEANAFVSDVAAARLRWERTAGQMLNLLEGRPVDLEELAEVA